MAVILNRKFNFGLLILGVLILLSGCQSTSKPTSTADFPAQLLSFPRDSKILGDDIVDVQLALADRNLYLSNNDRIKMLATEQCSIDISAHRGDFREPENSARAITSALKDNFNSVEIDVMLLRDGTWVNHHDKQSGRATVYYSGQRHKIEKMSLRNFGGLKLRAKNSNELPDERPITAYESFKAFADYRNNQQQLNVEVKSDATGHQLNKLDQMLRLTVGQGGFYYSSLNREVLRKLRGINAKVYIGFIAGAHPTSVSKLRAALKKGVKDDSLYRRYMKEIETVGNYSIKRYRAKYKSYSSAAAIKSLHRDFGANSGLHLDIRQYVRKPKIKQYAQRLGMKVYTYAINGSDYHQGRLVALGKNRLPDGVIVDATPYRLCQKLFKPSIAAQRHHALSPSGAYIMSLPNDADFDRLEEMLGYRQENYYIALSSRLAPIKKLPSKSSVTKRLTVAFPTIKDQTIKSNTSKAIVIKLSGYQQ